MLLTNSQLIPESHETSAAVSTLYTYQLLLHPMLQQHKVHYVHSTFNGDDLVAYMARVSNPANQHNSATAPKLISYLIKHNHWSPFEMVSMCLKIDTTRSVASQILRHRSFSFQEFSQRYAEVTGEPFIPDLRRQDSSNRQNSIDDLDSESTQFITRKIQSHYRDAVDLYQYMLDNDVAKECARDVLPLSTPTTLYMHGNVRSWIHYTDLRSANGTQLEHQHIAKQCGQLLKVHFPYIYAATRSKDY